MNREQSVSDRAAELLRGVRARRAAIDDDDEVIAMAMLAGAARHRKHTWTRGIAMGSGALALAAAVTLAFVARSPEAPSTDGSGELLAIQLSTGDTLSAVAGASFRVDEGDGPVRRLSLSRGAMLFDVRPLAEGERFEVVTPDSTVTVVGTVFAVETGPQGTTVEVFEGRVRVRDEDGERSIGAGEGDGRERGQGGIARLEARGREAAARRAEHPAAVPPTPPEVAPAEPVAAPEPIVEVPVTAPEVVAAAEPAVAPAVRPARERVAPPEPPADEVRAWIASGRVEDALAMARAGHGGRWRFVEADALRALRRWDEAAPMYERAASELSGFERAQAAYLGASLWMSELADPRGAVRALDLGGVDSPGSPLRERGMVLRARALDALGDGEAVARIAREYVDEYPQGSRGDWMRARLR